MPRLKHPEDALSYGGHSLTARKIVSSSWRSKSHAKMPPRSREEFNIAIICALPLEGDAVEALFDERYDELGHIYSKHMGDANSYVTGRINNHNVVLAYMPGMGNRRSAGVARGLHVSFTGIKLTLLVGICGGVPYASDGMEIVLGDIIIGDSVIEYDFGRQYPHGFERKSSNKEALGSPNQQIQSFLNRLRTRRMKDQVQRQTAQYLKILQEMEGNEWNYPGVSQDRLFRASYRHKHYKQQYTIECICADCHSSSDPVCEQALKGDCKKVGCGGEVIQRSRLNTDSPRPLIHIGTIASANSVLKSGEHRDQLAEKEGVIGFEMEAAGVWDILPCVIIKGVCDYADSHKNKAWQNYAAATAASCTKTFLEYWITGLQQERLPFERDEKFVGREDITMSIDKAVQDGKGRTSKRAALVGLGGVGKSQIAIEYTYRIRESAPSTWIFWVHGSNPTRFEQGYRNIASVAKVPGFDDPEANILQLVTKWLCDETNGSWLMVLDNADDNDTFFKTSGENVPLVDYLPCVLHGSILITSRNQIVARNIVGPRGQVIPVKPMSTHDAITLLRTRIEVDQSCVSEAKLLVEALECIPLAIAQAGAYISNRSPRMTVSSYLELFQQSETNQEHLLNYDEAHDLRRDRSVRYPVITTWQISFDQIHHIYPKATDLLALMSMFDRQGIPEELVSEGMDRLQFEDAIALLISFSLIQVEIGGRLFELHRLVQLSVRQWLKKQGRLHQLVKQSLRVMKAVFPSGDYQTSASCHMLLPHFKETIYFTKKLDDNDQLNIASIASRCGWHLYLMGKYEEAEVMHRRAVTMHEKVLGAEHPDTLVSVSHLGLVLRRQVKYKEAEAMHRRAVTYHEKMLGAEHPNTLASISHLGLVLESQGKYKEADTMHQQALDGREKVLGAEHPDTLTSVSYLGSVLQSQGEYEKAEAMHRRALAGREKVLGAEHPDTLISISLLGSVLQSQGQYEEAEAMHRQALASREKVLGAEHPSTLASISHLGLVLHSQGKYKEADTMHQQALAGREKVLGAEHPDTLASISHLGSVLHSQGEYEEAEAMHRQALASREKVLGAEHPETLASISHLGSVLQSQGQYEEAEAMHRRALASREKVLGTEHPDTLASISHLSSVLSRQGKCEEAKAMHRRALERNHWLSA
ncbi:kinesin, putative [Talaromyces stipitatus ATCC 10500]|uniref:Kinesin, putative n=1 Tax=Talaromyces stipitatus (strain ATCC 10500 / CBS 375.48 / QM 6759 / NRRL 1006) TaxID=441959 RepID=B8MM22_TALSN|nr:kinesin, putative [Talaromyces stipitatus ATCC 10500]EED13534.1 kinesin, putative [Talaromyces stipitatus ATCC 10500]